MTLDMSLQRFQNVPSGIQIPVPRKWLVVFGTCVCTQANPPDLNTFSIHHARDLLELVPTSMAAFGCFKLVNHDDSPTDVTS